VRRRTKGGSAVRRRRQILNRIVGQRQVCTLHTGQAKVIFHTEAQAWQGADVLNAEPDAMDDQEPYLCNEGSAPHWHLRSIRSG